MEKNLLYLEEVLNVLLSIQRTDERLLFLVALTIRLQAYNHAGHDKEKFIKSFREMYSTHEDMLETSENLFKILFPA